MTIDERLRRGLRADVDPHRHADLDIRAGRAIERGYRRRRLRRVGSLAAVAAVVAGAAIVSPHLMRTFQGTTPAGPPSLTDVGAVSSPLIGTFRITVSSRESLARELGAVGRWTLVLSEDGRISIGRDGAVPIVSDVVTTSSSISIRDLLCPGVGRYAWGRNGPSLDFSVIRDPCALRRYLLGGPQGHPWHEAPGSEGASSP